MAKFRKRPVVIEAVRFIGGNGFACADWCGGSFGVSTEASDKTGPLYVVQIQTLEGGMTASEGDWIIRGVKSEFYPCKPDIFEATYEPVEEGEGRDDG